jgi:hypothetical protein
MLCAAKDETSVDIICRRFSCIFVKCRCYIYMDETFILQLARASDI